MKNKEVAELIREKTREISTRILSTLDQRIEGMISKAIMSLLGLEGRWNENIEIDHCNGRNSVLIDIIREKAKSDVERLVKGFKFNDQDNTQIAEAFRSEYRRNFDYALKQRARDIAEREANEYANKITKHELLKMGFDSEHLEDKKS